jgi:GNAT superfamily N-acetyltransferase
MPRSATSARARGAHWGIGVARAWRGRGVAGALKRAQIAAAKRHGLARLVARNEFSNKPIRRLNAHLGYRETRVVITFRGPLA